MPRSTRQNWRAKFLPPTPFLFARLFRLRPEFFGGATIFKLRLPHTTRARTTKRNSLKQIDEKNYFSYNNNTTLNAL
jgi:hypothetical protein